MITVGEATRQEEHERRSSRITRHLLGFAAKFNCIFLQMQTTLHGLKQVSALLRSYHCLPAHSSPFPKLLLLTYLFPPIPSELSFKADVLNAIPWSSRSWGQWWGNCRSEEELRDVPCPPWVPHLKMKGERSLQKFPASRLFFDLFTELPCQPFSWAGSRRG